MTTEANYTPEEWNTLLQAPVMAGMLVILAGKTGPFQAIKEMFAISKGIASVDKDGTSNELIRSLVASVKAHKEIGKDETMPRPGDVEAARSMAVTHLQKVNDVLAAKSTTDEAQGFKQWLVSLSSDAANAAKEGGFLGFGGRQVTEEEQQAMQQVAQTLGVASPLAGGGAAFDPGTTGVA